MKLLQSLRVLLLVSLALTACGKSNGEIPEAEILMSEETTRAINKDNYSVSDGYGLCYVYSGDLYVNETKVDVEVLPLLNTTLSKVGTWLYYLGKDGLVRYDLATRVTEKVYFDDIDHVAVGKTAIYYIVDKGVYSFNGETYTSLANTWDGRYFYVKNNYFLYSTEEGVIQIDLITNEGTFYRGTLKEIVTTDFGFTLRMNDANVSIR